MIQFDYSKASRFLDAREMENMKAQTEAAVQTLENKSGAGNDFLGWVDLPVNYDKQEFARIKQAAEKIKSDSDILIAVSASSLL